MPFILIVLAGNDTIFLSLLFTYILIFLPLFRKLSYLSIKIDSNPLCPDFATGVWFADSAWKLLPVRVFVKRSQEDKTQYLHISEAREETQSHPRGSFMGEFRVT